MASEDWNSGGEVDSCTRLFMIIVRALARALAIC